MTTTGRCPECGTPTGLSVSGDLLRYADPVWVNTLAIGVTWALWAIGVSVAVTILGVISGSSTLAAMISLAGSVVGVYGAWLLTTPDPSGIGEDPLMTARKIVRGAIIIGLAGSVGSLAMQTAKLPSVVQASLSALMILVTLVGVIGEMAKLHYLGRLASRIPDDGLANRARFLMWGYGICLGILALFGGLVALMAPRGAGGGAGGALIGLGCIAALAGLVMVVFAIMVVILLFRMRTALVHQAALAKMIWSQADQESAPSQ